MVNSHVEKDDLAERVDYASIYSQSPEEFSEILEELKSSGKVAIESSAGDYYKLYTPLNIGEVSITHCRVRVADKQHLEEGYADFEVKDYPAFKNKYLSKPYFSLLNEGEEMIELKDPSFSVRAYFLSGKFY